MASTRSLRGTELTLTTLTWLIISIGLANLGWASRGEVYPSDLLPVAVLIGFSLVAHVFMVWSRWRADELVLPLVSLLCGLGLVQVARLAPSLLEKQITWLIIASTLLLVTMILPWPTIALKRYKYTAALLGLGLVAITLVFGVDPNNSGARLWLSLGGQYFQPAEALKVLLVIFLAGYLDDKRELLSVGSYRVWRCNLPPLPYLGPLLAMWGLSVVLLIGQRDLGPVMLLFGVFLAMLYMASSRGLYVWAGLVLLLAASFGGYRLFSVVQLRVDTWLDPWSDPFSSSYQLVQSLVALASGGVFGTGLGRGSPDLIPAAFTDFPFAALSEELGLFGSLAILILYALIVYRGFRLALRASNSFEQLLAAGLTTVLGLQTLIIVGGNVRLIPLTGITLPFVSYGGSSLLTNFIIAGLLLRISHTGERTADGEA